MEPPAASTDPQRMPTREPSPIPQMLAALPLASRGPISRRTFTQWLEQASAVATPQSAPVLIVIALEGVDDRHDALLIDAAAWQLCDALGDDGLVCRLGSARLGVMIASDGRHRPDSAATLLLGALARPIEGFSGKRPQGARLGMAHWGRHGTRAEALFTAAAYAVHDAEAAALEDDILPARKAG